MTGGGENWKVIWENRGGTTLFGNSGQGQKRRLLPSTEKGGMGEIQRSHSSTTTGGKTIWCRLEVGQGLGPPPSNHGDGQGFVHSLNYLKTQKTEKPNTRDTTSLWKHGI